MLDPLRRDARGRRLGRWLGGLALALSFAAYRQSLDESLQVGTSIRADLHRYPGEALRALIGDRFGDPTTLAVPPAGSVLDACGGIGADDLAARPKSHAQLGAGLLDRQGQEGVAPLRTRTRHGLGSRHSQRRP